MSRVEQLWARMAAIYPHSWTSAVGDDPSGIAAETWSSALAGLSPEQLAEGLRACIAEGREFPPSAGRFRAMCLGIPSLAQVKVDLLAGGKPGAFSRLVWRYIDTFAFRQARQGESDRMLADAYAIAHEKVMRGEPLPEEPAGEIEHEQRKPVPASRETAQRYIGEIDQLLPKPAPASDVEMLVSDEAFIDAAQRAGAHFPQLPEDET